MEQLDPYFAEEATELLQTIEQTLLSLFDEGKTTEKVHTLLRCAHTIKGSAASQNFDTIQTIAHHLEDVFQALYAPELEIDSELTTLLLEGYECLRFPLNAILSENEYDEAEILDRVTSIFAQLQDKLGDFFGRQASIPSSEELGFDVVASIFSDSVPEDLHQLQNIILSENTNEIKQTLLTQANFFLSLAQSYNLPGLEKISNSILTALESSPNRVLEIGLVALENLQEAQKTILAGDRQFGGEVSSDLLAFIPETVPEIENNIEEKAQKTTLLTPQKRAVEVETETETETETLSSQELESAGTIPLSKEKSLTIEQLQEITEERQEISSDYDLVKIPQLENVAKQNFISALANQSTIERILNSLSIPDIDTQKSLSNHLLKTPPKPVKKRANYTIKVGVELLDSINYSIGELIVEENQSDLQYEHLNNRNKNLINKFLECQKQIYKINEWSEKTNRSYKSKKRKNRIIKKDDYLNDRDVEYIIPSGDKDFQFDSLEMDTYSHLHLLLQNLTEEITELGYQIDEIKTDIQKSSLQSRKRKQILFSARENLFQARMVELSVVLNRFPRILEQMIATHKKLANLNIIGAEVLIDKSISEKLYEPILHLIRNAYDHGLESSEIRLKNGKPETGKITIKAFHRGNRTTIKISDDGSGLNWEKIRQKALTKNLITTEDLKTINQKKLTEILFQPGFSTAEEVSDLSGRGVGLDVVRNQLEVIGGSIKADSISGKGTTFTLELPLNSTTARLLICQCRGFTYALITKSIKQILLPNSQQIKTQNSSTESNSQVYLIWNKNEKLIPIVPFVYLFRYSYSFKSQNNYSSLTNFPVKGSNKIDPLLILESGKNLFCLQVDRVLFEQEILIKSFNNKIDLPSYIQGYSILGNGNLTLVVDPIELIAKNSNIYDSANFQSFNNSPKIADKKSKDLKLNSQQKKTTILTIEDSIVQRKSLMKMIQKNGYQVIEASNGKEAIKCLQKHRDINLIFCDIEMPVMNGFEFLAYRRKHSRFSEIPVVMLTTRSSQKHKELARNLGATKYRTKPCSEAILLKIISQLTKSK